MSEPLTAGVAAGSAGVTFAALFPEATPAVMICALAGAALYVLSSGQHRFWKQVIFALIAFVGGVYCAETASAIITGILNAMLSHLNPPVTVKVSPAIGALVASVISVTSLLRIMSQARLWKSDKGMK
ncbi:phage holin family protein [Escherichia whittamii]|uniref:Exported phage-related protein n=1 Tax=Escherichia whittamii TaxID=2762229 RepID=A0ABR8TAI2_9ESCH|nr:putative holin [Escherichia whittamii]MBD7972374.1 hypothetical protein [Escherichia whittamii]MCA4890613.1 phage holin family protein [Escherichia whittamii]